MLDAVVDSVEDDILEREAALMGEVVVAQQLNDLFDAHTPLGRHQLAAQLVGGRMQAYRHMAVALLDEALQLVAHSHRRYRDALGAPGITVVGGEHLGGSQHIVEIVHRFALAHKHDVGQRVVLGQ